MCMWDVGAAGRRISLLSHRAGPSVGDVLSFLSQPIYIHSLNPPGARGQSLILDSGSLTLTSTFPVGKKKVFEREEGMGFAETKIETELN